MQCLVKASTTTTYSSTFRGHFHIATTQSMPTHCLWTTINIAMPSLCLVIIHVVSQFDHKKTVFSFNDHFVLSNATSAGRRSVSNTLC
jgi:hypothetical protein